ncbi:MAG: histidine triad nucleotide-binding protein [Planctomycetota bacterium]
MLSENIFLKIISKAIPVTIIHEDSECIAFNDINPQAPVHILIIPKKEIKTHADLMPEDANLMGHLHLVATKIAKDLGLEKGYRLVINCKEIGGQTVPHIHMHLLGGRNLSWPPG